jgi:peptide/nickel transport system substrate-binding protein
VVSGEKTEPKVYNDVLIGTLSARLNRRVLLQRGAALGLAAPVFAGLLAACDDDEADEDAAASVEDESDDTEAEPEDEEDVVADGDGEEEEDVEEEEEEEDPSEDADADPDDVPDDGEPRQGGVMRVALHRDLTGIDPHAGRGVTAFSVQGNVYDPLLEYGPDGEVVPCLAHSWETEDSQTWIFHLEEGVTFHNGEPFTAEDVIYTFDQILDEAYGAVRRAELGNMESYEAIDDYTVEITMSEPYATLTAVLANDTSAMISRNWDGDYTQETNGTGAFMLDSFEPDVLYMLVKFDDHWRADRPYVDAVEVRPIEDTNARINALLSGEVDFTEYVEYQFFDDIESDDRFQLYAEGWEVFVCARFNESAAPVDDPLVRQALNYATDRDALVSLVSGDRGLSQTAVLITPDSPWFIEEHDGHWHYDPDLALELLQEAGYDDFSDLTLNIESTGTGSHFDMAEVVSQQWENLGISINWTIIDGPTRDEKRRTGEYVIMFDGLGAPWPDPDFYTTYFGTGGAAHAAGTGYSNSELDAILDEARQVADADARKDLYRQAEEIMLEEANFVFGYWRPHGEAGWSYVHGYERIPGQGRSTMRYFDRMWMEEQ